MAECIFCKIVAGALPASVVYQDEQTLAFLDINPLAVGHTLVIPKVHYERLTDLTSDDLSHTIGAAQKVAGAVVAATEAQGFTLLQSNGACAEQVVPHVHFHIVPRHRNDGIRFVQPRQNLSGPAHDAVATKIKTQL